MRYYEFQKIGANWSTTARFSDYSMSYPVVDYTKYAHSLDEFLDKYRYVKIETNGRAVSWSTFGDVGKGHFGTLTFETILFNHTEYYNKVIVNAHLDNSAFNVGVEIGLGFKVKGNRLYLRPFINGWIYSGGMNWRYLDFGLEVTSITFYSEQNEV